MRSVHSSKHEHTGYTCLLFCLGRVFVSDHHFEGIINNYVADHPQLIGKKTELKIHNKHLDTDCMKE